MRRSLQGWTAVVLTDWVGGFLLQSSASAAEASLVGQENP